MTTNLFERGAVGIGMLACALVVANCNRPAPEQLPVLVAVEPAPVPPAPRVVALPRPAAITTVSDAVTTKARVLLAQGTDIDLAARGFRSPQQFLAVAYASKNLRIPFVLLKDKVLAKQMSLARAINTTMKNVDGALEAARAESEAKADLARKAGPA
jgi:hypothetical protein